MTTILCYLFSSYKWPIIALSSSTIYSWVESLGHFGEPLTANFLLAFVAPEFSFWSFFFLICSVLNYYNKRAWFLCLFLFSELDYTTPVTLILGATRFTSPTPNLLNGFVFIHPVILYLSCGYICLLLFRHEVLSRHYLYIKCNDQHLISISFYWTLAALSLGSLWAQQELNWGGWWSSDLVELGAFNLILICIFFFHFKNWAFMGFSCLYLSFISFNFFFIGLRYGFFDSIHSFIGSTQADFTAFSYVYILIMVLYFYKLQFPRYHRGHIYLYSFNLMIFGLFVHDFLIKYYINFSFYEFGNMAIILFLFFLVGLTLSNSYLFTLGFGPFFLLFFNFIWLEELAGYFFHCVLILTLIGIIITKFIVFYEYSFGSIFDLNWVIHNTYILMFFYDFVDSLANFSGFFFFEYRQGGFSWWFLDFNTYLDSAQFLNYCCWIFKQQVFTVTTITVTGFIIPGFSFFFIWNLIKKSDD